MATAQASRKSKQSTKSEATRPVQEIRMGRIRAAIWENETTNGARYNVTISRLYKDGDQWKDSASFGRDDLPLVAKVADRCHSWIFAESGNQNDNNGTGSDEQRNDESF